MEIRITRKRGEAETRERNKFKRAVMKSRARERKGDKSLVAS